MQGQTILSLCNEIQFFWAENFTAGHVLSSSRRAQNRKECNILKRNPPSTKRKNIQDFVPSFFAAFAFKTVGAFVIG